MAGQPDELVMRLGPTTPAKIIASFPLPADWETVERMLNAVWKDGPEWSGANTVAGVRWILDEHDGHLLVVDVSEEA